MIALARTVLARHAAWFAAWWLGGFLAAAAVVLATA